MSARSMATSDDVIAVPERRLRARGRRGDSV
ncbi:Uncharacterised protein [Nocardia otitidiscaviarum]|uniref:Uncharacterized protein n=1 Tax=Nocardia otitidiscaviarum TaxID=1823 RepID=A0A379JLD5_9NOCA|nr:Uncharacterised protein [Nocardia otitidiscaviarum]